MTDRTVPQLKNVIKKYLKKWITNLYLGMWQIDFNIRDYLKNDRGEFETAATCDSNWQYFYANLNFSYAKMRDLPDYEIEKIVLHELLHVAVNETRAEGIENEERVVSHLTMAFKWMDK